MKISSMPPKGPVIDAVDKSRNSMESKGAEAATGVTSAAASPSVDPIAQVASDVAAGKISRKEAVDRILADVLGSKLVAGVPASARADLENTLRMLIDEDPHLKSLCAAIAPGETE
jgi:hypothetical protein